MPSNPTDPVGVAFSREEEDTDSHVVNIASFRRSRYERNGRALPHLGDDPDWTPATFELPSPVNDEPQRWFDRFRR
ncbi:MAG: hypothetical protein WCC01_13390 [Acidimicrobiia bacterium]